MGKKYEKPTAEVLEGVSEGIYTASGSTEDSECWTVKAPSVQDWNGSHHVFEVQCAHSTSVEHISSGTTVTLIFNQPIIDACSEFPCVFNGSKVTITRDLHANAYKSGDNMTYKVWAKGIDEATTKGLMVVSATIRCSKTVNVQGRGGDGN